MKRDRTEGRVEHRDKGEVGVLHLSQYKLASLNLLHTEGTGQHIFLFSILMRKQTKRFNKMAGQMKMDRAEERY